MHADYLEIKKNFLSHAAPKRSMAGMPSDVRKKGPAFSKFYNTVDKAPSDVKWKATGSNALSGYANDLNKKMQTMVNTGKQAVAQYNSALANAKQSNATSARFMDSLNAYNNVVRQTRSIGNSAKFKSATVKWRDINGAIAIYSCTLQDTDTDPGNQSW